MNSTKYIFPGLLVLILLASTMVGCTGKDTRTQEALNDFSKLISEERVDDLTLTIYYMSPYILTPFPWDVDRLISFDGVTKIVISGDRLKEHIDLLIQISNADLVPIKRDSYLDARLYYVFETEKGGKIFDIAWGLQTDKKGEAVDVCMFFNGIAVNENEVFNDIIIPFLPDDVSEF